ncbi:reverse transcriptase-rnase h-integrase [Moniliophthora roreri MCA 2997]|uniref:Reverse transcriptase-rnase h-integrase n=1 Tax=Moniliophthora roreri (strain MCA 2997) TaxID=1381753 RepID=V2XW16_MONRO|nr:reverse transcriptase-rnase h-integrase [Moniliophthora roreri MCA 2997]
MAKQLWLPRDRLPKNIQVFNVDGTLNKTAWITHSAMATYSIRPKMLMDTFLLSGLGKEDVIFRLPWLQRYNPDVNWRSEEITFRPRRYIKILCHRNIFNSEAPEEIIKKVDIRAKMSVSQTMAHQVEQKEQSFEELVPKYPHKFRAQFEDREAEHFPISRHYNHAIDLKPDFVAKDCKLYSLTVLEQCELDKFLEENLWKGYIQKSKSPNASSFFFVGKKEKGKLQPTQDYWRLNDGTIKNAYPLLLISDLIDKLCGATIFSKLDLHNRYNNVRIKDGDQWKAAFKTNQGLFEPTVMFFGLMNSLATFQVFMDDILSNFMAEGWCLVYMDDILIYSTNADAHQERSQWLFQRLREQDLFLKPHKCEFDVTEVIFLGLVIWPGTIGMDPVKLAGIEEWPAPTTVTGVQSFTGFVNFYWKFIGRYTEIAWLLYDLTKKEAKFVWDDQCQAAFTMLKRKFSKQPLLQILDSSKPFVIEVDTSKWASGAVLWQKGEDGEWHPCGYISHVFNTTERNYEIYDRELFTIVWALQIW